MNLRLPAVVAISALLTSCDGTVVSSSNDLTGGNLGTGSEPGAITGGTGLGTTASVGGVTEVTALDVAEKIISSDDPTPSDEINVAKEAFVKVALPPGASLDGTAYISLEDTYVSDTDAIVIGTTSVPAESFANGAEVPIFLPLPIDNHSEIAVTVRIDNDINDDEFFSPIDLISLEFAYFQDSVQPVATVNLLDFDAIGLLETQQTDLQ